MDLNVKLVLLQEHGILIKINVFALHQNQFGMEINAFAEEICMVTIVFLVQLQEFGITLGINVFAQLQKLFGVELIVSALQVHMVISVYLVLLQDIGIPFKINVFVEVHLFGMDQTVLALSHTFWMLEVA